VVTTVTTALVTAGTVTAGNVVTTVTTTLVANGTETVTAQTFVPPPPNQPLPKSVTPVPTEAASGDIVTRVQDATSLADQAIDQCQVNQTSTPPCVADSLDALADALEKLAPEMPPQLRTLPGIVRTAARNVRAARTKREAIAAIKTAIAQVHKSIELLKASDPTMREVGTREGAFVVQTLEVATAKLEKATGL
jgi:hypothetical protein